jgi:AcrR family transcriptional regulator
MPEKGAPKNLKAKAKDAQRTALLEIAVELLEQEGAVGLSMRRIAERANCSTTMLYTLFGGKDELANSLYLEGFRRLGVMLHAVGDVPPLEGVKRLIQTYRRFALAHKTFYALMFERPIAELEIALESRARAWETMMPLQNALRQAIEANLLRIENLEEFAMQLWMMTHGVVSLELAGYLIPPLSDGWVLLEGMIEDVLKSHHPALSEQT